MVCLGDGQEEEAKEAEGKDWTSGERCWSTKGTLPSSFRGEETDHRAPSRKVGGEGLKGETTELLTIQVWGVGLQTSVPFIPEKLSGRCPVGEGTSVQSPIWTGNSHRHVQGSWSSGRTTCKVWHL